MPSRRQPAWLRPIVAGTADPAKVEAWAAQVPTEWADCRGKRQHDWKRYDAKRIKGGYIDLWHCGRCEVRQEFLLDTRFRVVKAGSVKYADGYLAPRGAGRIEGEARDAFRGVGVLAFIEGRS